MAVPFHCFTVVVPAVAKFCELLFSPSGSVHTDVGVGVAEGIGVFDGVGVSTAVGVAVGGLALHAPELQEYPLAHALVV
jgi:hypothetical protein